MFTLLTIIFILILFILVSLYFITFRLNKIDSKIRNENVPQIKFKSISQNPKNTWKIDLRKINNNYEIDHVPLLPCPFCGSIPSIYEGFEYWTNIPYSQAFVKISCEHCKIEKVKYCLGEEPNIVKNNLVTLWNQSAIILDFYKSI